MKLYIDGGCSMSNQKDLSKRNMVSVVTDEDGEVLVEKQEKGGSNNIAEFLALKEALKYCVRKGIDRITIITDSRNNTFWFKKLKRGKQNDFERVFRIRRKINKLKKGIEINLIWEPRETNLAGQYIEDFYNL